jgi:hypothetical protein
MFEQLYKRIINNMEKFERKLSVVLMMTLILMVVSQAFLFFYSDHMPLNRAARLEGQSLHSNNIAWQQQAHLVLHIEAQSTYSGGVYAMINGERRVLMRSEDTLVVVYDGDILEIDGSDYQGTVVLTIKDADRIIEQPEIGQKLVVTGRIEKWGKIEFKK